MEYGYRDKAYLSNYILDTRLFDSFDFLVEDAAPVRSVYLLTTDSGLKILKKIDYGLDELMFICRSLEIIRERYPYVINFRESKEKKPYVKIGNDIYIVLDVIDGRDCVFENPLDLSKASTALSNLHEAGRFVDVIYNRRNNLGKMTEIYINKIENMKKFREIAKMHINKSEFDMLYLNDCDYYIECGLKALDQLKNSSYLQLCNEYHTLCHHDLAHHNILIDDNSNVYFIDFDYALIDCPYHDISNLITKAIKHNEWTIDIAETIIESYSSVRKLKKDELAVLYAYLMFPQDFYDISTSYYMKSRDWDEDEFVEKLKRKAGYKDERERFLDDFCRKWVE